MVAVISSHHSPPTVQTREAGTQQPSKYANAALRGSPRDTIPALALSLCGQHEAALEQIEAGTAKHLALERFQAINVALHRAITPGQRHAGFDGVIIVAQALRKPLQRHDGTLGRPCQPGIQLLCLPLTHQLGKILGERNGIGELGLLRRELRQQVLLRWRALLRPSQDQPGRPARGQGAVQRCGHDRQGMTSSPLLGCHLLGVAQTLRIARHGGIAPGISPLLELAEEPQGVTAAGVPTVEETSGVGRENTAAAVRTALAFGQGLRPKVAKHGILANPQLLGNGSSGHPCWWKAQIC